MESSKQMKLVVCSAMVKPARLLIFYKLRTWLDQVVHIVVHTFAVEESKLPLDSNDPDGYWYCAGDFCDIDEAGVYQHLISADIDFAKCLVAPNIKDDHPNHSELVIAGEFGVHYVCHNITNRVLYATENCHTLIDLDIKTTGYEIVVKSPLGIYGQNKVEWERRKLLCSDKNTSCLTDATNNKLDRTREEEINNIHLRAVGGNFEKAQNLTDLLDEIDSIFYSTTESLISQFDSRMIDEDSFHSEMLNASAKLFSETISTVGRQMTQRIYPGCNIGLEVRAEPIVEDKEIFVASS